MNANTRPFIYLALLLGIMLGGILKAPTAYAASPDITKAEWSAFLASHAGLRKADAMLNATYRTIMESLSHDKKRSLLNEQRNWIRARNTNAFSRFAKGSPEYLEVLTEATRKRDAALQAEHIQKTSTQRQTAPSSHGVPQTQVALPKAKETAPSPETPNASSTQQLSDAAHSAALPKPEPRSATDTPRVKTPVKKSTVPPATAPANNRVVPHLPQANNAPENAIAAKVRRIPISSTEFAKSYNAVAETLKASSFPQKPSNTTNNGTGRTNHYTIGEGATIQFKYAAAKDMHPEIITFLAHKFMKCSPRNKEDVAYALLSVIKTLSKSPARGTEAQDAEIFKFIRELDAAFTSKSSRIWRHKGLVYVTTYMKKTDIFAMVVTVDKNAR